MGLSMSADLRAALSAPPQATAGQGVDVRRATSRDFDATVRLLTTEMAASPLGTNLVHDASNRYELWRQHFSRVVLAGLEAGVIDVAGAGSGVAVWLPHTHRERADDEPIPVESIAPADRLRVFHRYAQLVHPDSPHLDLVVLAVDVKRRGHGLAGALLRYRHTVLDAADVISVAHADDIDTHYVLHRFGYTTTMSPRGPDVLPLSVLQRSPRAHPHPGPRDARVSVDSTHPRDLPVARHGVAQHAVAAVSQHQSESRWPTVQPLR